MWVSERPLARIGLVFCLSAAVIAFSLVLGGGTRAGFLSDVILQLVALPLLLVTLWRLFDVPLSGQACLAIGFCLAIVSVPLLQLIPLPPAIWTQLPGREISAQAFDLIGEPTPWMPISVSPHLTWLSAISLITPLAIFLSVLFLSYRERRWLSLVILAVGTVSVFIGLAQVAQGPESALRFYAYTNPSEAVGFFANRNHFAALGYVLVVFAAAWAANATLSVARIDEGRDTTSIIAAVAWFTLLVVLLAGEAMARSRAGLGLTILALFGAFALGVSDRRVGAGLTPTRVLGSAIVFAVLLAVQYALYRILERFEADPLADARLSFIPTTVEAAKAYMPLGSGLGSFVPVYALFEKPEHALLDTYANHAHNDIVELWLETGILGLLFMASFALWFTVRTLQIWRRAPMGVTETDASLARAATLIIALLIAHSVVDYPLRTSALMGIFAFCCALMIEPQGATEIASSRPASHPVKRSRSTKPEPTQAPAAAKLPVRRRAANAPPNLPAVATPPPSPGQSRGERWGADMEWPEEWRKDKSGQTDE